MQYACARGSKFGQYASRSAGEMQALYAARTLASNGGSDNSFGANRKKIAGGCARRTRTLIARHSKGYDCH